MDNSTKTIDRLIVFIEHLGLSARQFDISIGASNGYILRMKKNNASIGSDVLEKVTKIYPELNIKWLITGKGQMLTSMDDKNINVFEDCSDSEIPLLKNIIRNKIESYFTHSTPKLIDEIVDEIIKFYS